MFIIFVFHMFAYVFFLTLKHQSQVADDNLIFFPEK